MLREGTVLRGVYRIDGYLSSGGFGNTYVATNVEFDEKYAIKEFFMRGVSQRDGNNTTVSVSNAENETAFASQLEKFKKEARRLRKLHSDHIVRVYDLFEENGTAYYVMDLIDGESLSEWLKRTGKPLTEAEVLRILPQVLDALDAAHSARIWHLDLKPANIMIDRQGNVKLIDFGASKQRRPDGEGATTNSTTIAYTPGYAPIEQIEQELEEFGPWTDFYALGATLYTLLTNRKPPSPTKILRDSSSEKASTLPLPQAISPKTKRLILLLMSYDSNDRPQSVAQIRNFLANDEDDDTVIDDGQTETDRDSREETQVSEKKVNADADKGDRGEKETKETNPDKPPQAKKHIPLALAIIGIVAVIGGIVLFSSKSGQTTQVDKKLTPAQQVVIDNIIANMVPVEGGTFTMGATPEQDKDVYDDEKPAHEVTLSDFSIGKYEVTQKEWKTVMGSNPSYFKGDNRPVECVSWDDCQKFIGKLNSMTGKHFRLLTEAEWEYAARGGNKSKGYKYAGSNNIDAVAWYADNSGNTTHDVGTKQPNELGLYDMSGNVWEWCQDWYSDYSSNSQTNPAGPSLGSNRVIRGGSWYYSAGNCRVSYRNYYSPVYRYFNIGLRLAL